MLVRNDCRMWNKSYKYKSIYSETSIYQSQMYVCVLHRASDLKPILSILAASYRQFAFYQQTNGCAAC
jgi:hypothetical protein